MGLGATAQKASQRNAHATLRPRRPAGSMAGSGGGRQGCACGCCSTMLFKQPLHACSAACKAQQRQRRRSGSTGSSRSHPSAAAHPKQVEQQQQRRQAQHGRRAQYQRLHAAHRLRNGQAGGWTRGRLWLRQRQRRWRRRRARGVHPASPLARRSHIAVALCCDAPGARVAAERGGGGADQAQQRGRHHLRLPEYRSPSPGCTHLPSGPSGTPVRRVAAPASALCRWRAWQVTGSQTQRVAMPPTAADRSAGACMRRASLSLA